MPGSLRSADVVVGLLTENTARMLAQAVRLVRSIRWFGGELATARVVVCGLGVLESGARKTLEALGAEVRVVTRFHPANPTGNRHQLIGELLDAPEEVLVLLDCDTLVTGDPLPFLDAAGFQAKIAPTPTVSDAVFERLFAHFELPKPPRAHLSPFSGTPTIAYFNAGVFAIPKALARTLAPVWRRYNQILADDPDLVAPCQRNLHQAALTLALVETGIPYRELPAAMNYQINAPQLTPPPGFAETDPVIIHYHHLATDDGFLLPCPYPAAQARIDLFHERMRAEGFLPDEEPASVAESRPIVILGMHRSGTSLVAELVNAFGVHAGRPDELAPPDMFNPTGYWEHTAAVKIDMDVLAALRGSWTDVAHLDSARLTADQRASFVERLRRVVESLAGRGPFLIKDPRMSVLFPLWREVLSKPVCVIAWRDPAAVARSVARRDKRPLVMALALWEHYNRTLLRDSAGTDRVLVSYDELLGDPMPVARALFDQLTAFGVRGLSFPSEERIRQIVNADFNRSGQGGAGEEALLNSEQTALVEGLRTGQALTSPVAATSAGTLNLLAEFSMLEKSVKALREQVSDRDQLLSAVFESRSWSIGHGLTSLVRLARRRRSVTAADRWEEIKRRRTE